MYYLDIGYLDTLGNSISAELKPEILLTKVKIYGHIRPNTMPFESFYFGCPGLILQETLLVARVGFEISLVASIIGVLGQLH